MGNGQNVSALRVVVTEHQIDEGGFARKTRESILVCEAAGYNVILVETVGTGQSEIAVRSMVDFFLLLLVPGAGDELQGIKKGVVEIAHAILINKADGDNRIQAKVARTEYNRALHYLTPSSEGWHTRAYIGSALDGSGIDKIWSVIESFQKKMTASGVLQAQREAQMRQWLHAVIEEQLRRDFYDQAAVQTTLAEVETAVCQGKLPPTAAALKLLQIYQEAISVI